MADWKEQSIGELFDVQLGKMLGAGAKQGAQCPYLANRNVRWGRVAIDDNLGTMHFSASERERYRLNPGDLLVCEGGEVGRAAIWSDNIPECYFQNAIHRLRPKTGIDVRYTRRYFEFAASHGLLRPLTGQTSIGHLPRANLVRWVIPVPPLEEQRQIAEILDTIDESIQATERVMTKLKLTRSGIREYLCATNKWDAAIATLAGLVEAIVDCPHSTPEYLSNGVLVARTMHIKDGRFLVSDASRVSEDVYRRRVDRMVPSPGDVVLTREAPVGEAFAVPSGMRVCLGQRVVLIRPGPELLGQYLVELIYSSQGQRQISRLVAGTTNPHLNVDEIYHLAFVVPPRHVQRDAIRSLGAIDSRLETEAQALQKLRQIRGGLAADLLSGRVRTVAT